MANPGTPPVETVAVITRLEVEQHELLLEAAKTADRSLAAELRIAVRFYLSSRKEENPE